MVTHQKGSVNKRAWIVFFAESGTSLLPQVRRTCALRADCEHGPRLCFHVKPGTYDTTSLIDVLERLKAFYAGESVVLVWDGHSAHWSRGMRALAAQQDWLTIERLLAYAPELNPVEMLWSVIKTCELANLGRDHLADVADPAERGSQRKHH
ncbi:transposase [Streptomyces sp. NPDC002144]